MGGVQICDNLIEYVLVPDFVGNITQIQDVMDPGYNRTFAYDDLGRLTTANSGASLWSSGSHAYDRMGNMTSMGLGAVRNLTFAYQGTTPKLMEVTENAVPRSVSYDPPGNEIQVGAGTFAYSTRNYLEAGEGLTYLYDGRGLRTVTRSGASRRYSLYSPEMNLLAETQLTDCSPPPSLYEYIWFGGKPVGQIDRGLQIICLAGEVGAAKQSISDPIPVPLETPRWTFTDHLGTPLIQTDSAAAVYWRAEHEPYGRVFALRTPDRHQPLRFPGQEAEQLDLGANGATERSYNVFRWYRYGWGRYSQADLLGIRGSGDINLYRYAADNPLSFIDPNGQAKVQVCCRPLAGLFSFFNSFDHHCFIRLITDNGVPITYSLFPEPGSGAFDGTGCLRINDPRDAGWSGNSNECVDTDCVDPGCISKTTRSYPCGGPYRALRCPNSNTFASNVATKCGLNVPLFANPTTAPCWGAPIAGGLPH